MILAIKRFVNDKFPCALAVIKDGLTFAKQLPSRRRIRHILKKGCDIFVEVGAGEKKGTGGWITIDVNDRCDIFWDLRRGIPFPDASIAKIYSSHFLEHLSFKEGQVFLNECQRGLRPGGTFSICVPNARIFIEAYLKDSALDESRFFNYKPAYNNTTRIDYVNYTAYMDGHHKYMFDEKNLIHILTAAGFRNATLRPFDPCLDLESRDFESIYAEAEK